MFRIFSGSTMKRNSVFLTTFDTEKIRGIEEEFRDKEKKKEEEDFIHR